jgi:3-hydroxybutyrate dehydrogenase
MIGDINLRPEARALLAQYPPGPGRPGDTAAGAGPPAALFQETNVRSWPHLNALWHRALTAFPHVDIVVPGAGLFEPLSSSFWNAPRTATNPSSPSLDAADADPGSYAVIDINLVHPARMSQLAIGHWSRRRRPGTLVHVSSVAGHTAGIGTPLYFATKHGVTALVRSLGDLKETMGVRVGAVAPGGVATPMMLEHPAAESYLAGGGREMLLEPEEVAEAMLALCEDPEYGDGTILEVMKGKRRVVPLFNAEPPAIAGSMLPGFAREQEALKERIRRGYNV